MNNDAILHQSKATYKQWAHQWREHATFHGKNFPMKSMKHFQNIGIGKACLCIANGYSFEENIEIIKRNQKKVDILCCDKTLGHCLDNDIIPTYCVVADANVSYETYLKKYEKKLKNTILFINVCANTKWSSNGNWKDIYFFVNKDSIKSEIEFCGLSGCENIIPAGTNVSNAMLILMSQSDDTGRKNFFGYDKYLLIGFDYSFSDDGYYAFDKTGNGKINYMKNIFIRDAAGRFCYTSNNLLFSAQWLSKYLNVYKIPVVQCSKRGIVADGTVRDLEEQMNYSFKPEDSEKVRSLVKKQEELTKEMSRIGNELKDVSLNHYFGYAASI